MMRARGVRYASPLRPKCAIQSNTEKDSMENVMNTGVRYLVVGVTSCILVLPSALRAQDGWATLKGKFVYDGAPPATKFLETSGKDSETCAKHKVPDESLLVDSASNGIANVLVFARKTPRVHDSQQTAAKDDAVFDQKECVFLSHVLPVRVGQGVVIKNSDPIGHNTNITTQADVNINPLLPPGEQVKHKFSRQQVVPVPVNCNIHPWMKAYILPRNDSYVAVSRADGSFQIANLPAGEEIEFQAWHERASGSQGAFEPKKDWPKGRFKLKLKAGETKDLGTITVSPRAFK